MSPSSRFHGSRPLNGRSCSRPRTIVPISSIRMPNSIAGRKFDGRPVQTTEARRTKRGTPQGGVSSVTRRSTVT